MNITGVTLLIVFSTIIIDSITEHWLRSHFKVQAGKVSIFHAESKLISVLEVLLLILVVTPLWSTNIYGWFISFSIALLLIGAINFAKSLKRHPESKDYLLILQKTVILFLMLTASFIFLILK